MIVVSFMRYSTIIFAQHPDAWLMGFRWTVGCSDSKGTPDLEVSFYSVEREPSKIHVVTPVTDK